MSNLILQYQLLRTFPHIMMASIEPIIIIVRIKQMIIAIMTFIIVITLI
jgi:hypothetical protein